MIQMLSSRFRRRTAALMYLVFYLPGMAPFYSFGGPVSRLEGTSWDSSYHGPTKTMAGRRLPVAESAAAKAGLLPRQKKFIGGPATPEASSFKTAGADNLVNLFTGDFSYSIPLLDVDGYPVNLFYGGGIGMEQEASWVGLGWNINPGSVSRNMRGVPDDFDGTDLLTQQQNVKPNETWGAEVGVDGEVVGIKKPKVNFTVGASFNNYLGPEMSLGAGISANIPIMGSLVFDKAAPLLDVQGLGLGYGANAKLSSRSGLTFTPSLNANLPLIDHHVDLGVGMSTSYNSRTGIKELNIHSQASASFTMSAGKGQYINLSIPVPGKYSTTISFARPSYMPTLRMAMLNSHTAVQIEAGSGMFGLRGAATIEGSYTKSEVADKVVNKPLVGYMYLDRAQGRRDAVMDFNRMNDQEVTPHTPVLSAPVYDYDIFTIQGEGTGGSIRAYRSDLGFMRDNETISRESNTDLGFDIAPAGHFGFSYNNIHAPTRSGNWTDASNTLNQTLQFKGVSKTASFENVYFRNPGEATVTDDAMITKIGRDNLVRWQLGGSAVSPRLQTQLEQFDKKTNSTLTVIPLTGANADNAKPRVKRSQVITMLTAEEAANVGLETTIRDYKNYLDAGNKLHYDDIGRVSDYRKKNHISEITVLETSGMRYVYGLPVYNKTQKDFTFSVKRAGDGVTNLVNYDADEPTINSSSITTNAGIDGYCSVQTTPAYASAFLLTGLLSPDYVDRTGDGITEDDLGSAVKFDYSKSADLHKWRTPRSNISGNIAHYNAGLRTERRDNKATISYGEREAWYLHAIESKSMIAIFRTSSRQDAKGVKSDVDGSIAATEDANQKLDSISLYTKAEIKSKGLGAAVPLKTVHFDYSYDLCNGTPDNPSGGKLTLVDIYFTFNGQSRASKNMYVFNYGTLNTDNPSYQSNGSDRWGTYKPFKDASNAYVNPAGLTNIDYPYTSQNKDADDLFAGAWGLKKILLPSGGQMEVQYEADDYAYVQNRRACNMVQLSGIGNSTSYVNRSSLYLGGADQYYVYLKLPAPLVNTDPAKMKEELYAKYLDGIGSQLAFKLNIKMPKGMEPLTVYSNYVSYGICPNSSDGTMIYLQLKPIDGKSPLATASVHFLIENLPAQAFPGYDMSGGSTLTAMVTMLGSLAPKLFNEFKGAEGQVRSRNAGCTVDLATSFVRLAAPGFFKYGGGYRVKRLLVKDNWNKMSQQYDSQYGQDYDYTTTAHVAGVTTTISSGVASYEPGIGSEENPFREILLYENQLPMAPAQYGAIEMPMLDGLFPSPVVGYSKITVRSIHRKGAEPDNKVVRSAIGKQVTEFYTAKDYPSYSAYTPMYNLDYHHAPAFSFFYKETRDRRTSSQGFLVETNDMHGKIKSQSAYSESDENTPLSFTVHTYKNTGANGLNDLVDFVHHDQNGAVTSGNMGVDMELMTDVREFDVSSTGTDQQFNLEMYSLTPPIGMLFIWPLQSFIENTYRAVTTTKLINYHAIEDNVIVSDKGSTVTTKTIAYDAETGHPLVTQTLNEFNDPIYNTSYPAYWAYSGMGPAGSNIDMTFGGVNISSGKILNGVDHPEWLESGDELYVEAGSGSPCGDESSASIKKLWVFDANKNTTALTVPAANKDLYILDSEGKPYSKSGVTFRIVRSGHRNLLGQSVAAVTSMLNPIRDDGGGRRLQADNSSNPVAASAIAFKEKWQTDNDNIPKTSFATINCERVEFVDCNGTLQAHVNPYTKGLVGNYKPYRSYVYYGSRVETDPTVNTTIRKNGYLSGFGSFWNFDANSNLVPDDANPKWVWNSELERINSKGQELETKDALGRYTAAVYGFDKELPIAVAQNARYGQVFSEGFEDNSYADALNMVTPYTCAPGYTDLGSLGLIQNTDTVPFKAHSGKYALLVKPNTTGNKSISLESVLSPFSLTFSSDVTKVLNDVGGNVDYVYSYPAIRDYTGQQNGQMSMLDYVRPKTYFSPGIETESNLQLNDAVISGKLTGALDINTSQYMKVSASGKYGITMISNWPGGKYTEKELDMGIFDLDGNLVKSVGVDGSPDDPPTYGMRVDDSVFLCKGIYRVTFSLRDSYKDDFTGSASQTCQCHSLVYQYYITANAPTYKSLNKINGCVYNIPIQGTDAMMNPVFNIPVNRQMVFSAWVREDCGNAAGTPCYATNYTNDHVTIQFPGSSTLPSVQFHPSGPIIEGWQKIEGSFTVPADATSASLQLSNDGSHNVYFDDIRIHPFNANMKSYIYDPRTLRLSAELDENNYASFYDYDEEGQLIRVKQETIQGIKTIKETRSSQQRTLKTVQ